MSLGKLKDYGLKFKDLKAMCKELNEAELVDPISIKVGVKGEEMLESFLDAIDSVSKKKVKDIPENVTAFYDGLAQEVFDDSEDPADVEGGGVVPDPENLDDAGDDAEPEKEKEQEQEVVSDCPTFLTGWDKDEDDCKECKDEYPEEYKVCKEATKAKAKDKPKSKAKGAGKRTRYGHVPGSMNEDIDNMLWKGAKRDTIIKKLMKKHKREERLARNKVSGHVAHLKANRGILVTESDTGLLKADKEFSTGFNADNTVTK